MLHRYIILFTYKLHIVLNGTRHGVVGTWLVSEYNVYAQVFMNMAVPPSVVSSDDDDDEEEREDGSPLKARGQSKLAPIAVVGAGPAGLTCATYLNRLGYRCVTVYESGAYAGGLRYV